MLNRDSEKGRRRERSLTLLFYHSHFECSAPSHSMKVAQARCSPRGKSVFGRFARCPTYYKMIK
jgi:hypothetical protein